MQISVAVGSVLMFLFWNKIHRLQMIVQVQIFAHCTKQYFAVDEKH